MKPLILASSSPRRKNILEKMGIAFTVDPSSIDEEAITHADPHELVKILSTLKVQEVATRHPRSIILAADTVVFCKKKILGKPKNGREARDMLHLLSGTLHQVITGFCILDTETKREIVDSFQTDVYFHVLSDSQIDKYIKTGEAFDKAGAYAIQEGKSQEFVKNVHGDVENAIGLPIKQILKALEQLRH